MIKIANALPVNVFPRTNFSYLHNFNDVLYQVNNTIVTYVYSPKRFFLFDFPIFLIRWALDLVLNHLLQVEFGLLPLKEASRFLFRLTF